MDATSFKKTKRILIASIVSCFLTIGVYGTFFYYISSLNDEVTDLKNTVSEKKSIEEEKNLADKTLQETATNRNKIDTFFIGNNQEEEANFVSFLEDTATNIAKVEHTIVGLRHEPIANVKNSKYEYLTIQGEAKGSFSETYHFLTLLENVPKASILQQVELEKISGDPKKQNEWRLSYVLRVLKIK
jgi:hypothetical protein